MMRFNCCICGREFIGFGNNPRPIKDSGRCCDVCNMYIVIPERLKMLQKEKKQK